MLQHFQRPTHTATLLTFYTHLCEIGNGHGGEFVSPGVFELLQGRGVEVLVVRHTIMQELLCPI